MHVHRATTTLDGEVFHWASLDGDTWLPINRPAEDTPEDAEHLAGLLEGDGNHMPLQFGRRILIHWDAEFVGSS